MIHVLSLRPQRPSEDFAIDYLIEWANGRGFRITDDRPQLGEATFAGPSWQHMLELTTELGAYRVMHGMTAIDEPLFPSDT